MSDQPPQQPEQPQVQSDQPGPEAPPAGQQPSPQFVPPHGQHQPPPPPGQYGYYPYQPHPPQPTNAYAVASIITSSLSLAILIFTAGLLSPITGIASVVGAVLGHKGKDDVDKGRAVQQRDLAVAGLWTGVAGIVLSTLALLAWIAVIVLAIVYDDTNSSFDFHRELNWE